jgi:uncharacterized protein YrrD
MRHGVREMQDFTVGATDGEIGEVKDVYFDDQHWTIRYMVVEIGGWLSGRKVLISPRSVREVGWDDEVIHVELSQRQVRQSPGIDSSGSTPGTSTTRVTRTTRASTSCV